jgi:hypothetical protein
MLDVLVDIVFMLFSDEGKDARLKRKKNGNQGRRKGRLREEASKGAYLRLL